MTTEQISEKHDKLFQEIASHLPGEMAPKLMELLELEHSLTLIEEGHNPEEME